MNALARDLRDLRKEINDLKSRLTRTHMTGKVVEVDNNKVKLELLGADPKTGEKLISPWIRVQEEGGDGLGGYSSYTQAVVGQTMRLLSPSGEIGQESLAIQDGHTDDNPRPADGLKKVFKHGDAIITIADGEITFAVGGNKIVINGTEIVTYGKTRLNDGNAKVHRVGDVDSAGDTAVGGASGAFA